MAENSLYTKQTNIGLFGAFFLFFLEKKSSEIIGNCREMAENSLYTKQTNIGLFGAFFLFFLEKKILLR